MWPLSARPRRAGSLAVTAVGVKRLVLVGPPGTAPALGTEEGPPSLEELGRHLEGAPWVAYSLELPLTRRFWQTVLGRPFGGDLRLVAPDLRAVTAAVEHGLGVSLLPAFSCADALARGTVIELHPVSGLAPTEPWFACMRAADADRRPVTEFVADLAAAAQH